MELTFIILTNSHIQPISAQCSISIPPKNVFRGIEMEHSVKMS